mmetsp:Transcript_25120/g.36788  ORF Transcript_25120/g.36788 Transcript_25120/m.36788 type:complete len:85 (-) Transcript_25120:594-848(-)
MIVTVKSPLHSAVHAFHVLGIERQIQPRELNYVDESSRVYRSDIRGAPHKHMSHVIKATRFRTDDGGADNKICTKRFDASSQMK